MPAPRTPASAWPVQVTTHGGLDLHPALSPQGDAVAFVSDRTGAFEIYVRGARRHRERVAAHHRWRAERAAGLVARRPAASPITRTARGGIWVMPARGGTPRQVAAAGSNPAWSPDGRRIAFQSDEHADVTPSGFGAQSGSTIWMVDADGGEPRQLTRSGAPMGGHAAPAWSADGRYLAFTRVRRRRATNGVWLAESGRPARPRRWLTGAGSSSRCSRRTARRSTSLAARRSIVRLPFDAVDRHACAARAR